MAFEQSRLFPVHANRQRIIDRVEWRINYAKMRPRASASDKRYTGSLIASCGSRDEKSIYSSYNTACRAA